MVALLLFTVPTSTVSFFTHAEDGTGSWLAGAPTLAKSIGLPANTLPTRRDVDCDPTSYFTYTGFTTASWHDGCLVNTGIGPMDYSGSALVFNETQYGVPLSAYGGYDYTDLPIPNQTSVLAASSSSVMGMYLHLYTHFPYSVEYDLYNHPKYTVYDRPQVDLLDQNGNRFPANIYSRSFSANGSWMVVEDMQNSMLRINMATLQATPFAPSLANSQSDYNTHYAHTAISDDGRFAAIYNYDHHSFRLYDLDTCTGNWTPSFTNPPDCQWKDLLPTVNAQVPALQSISSVRFTNDDNLNFDATYNYHSGSDYAVARFNLTAYGGQQHKIDYLALGDSYISGEGTFYYKQTTDTDLNHCHISRDAYPYIVGADLFNGYESVACSGAMSKDITGAGITNYDSSPNGAQSKGMSDKSYDNNIYSDFLAGYRIQKSFASRYQPRVITLSIGGNDIGFADIIKACVSPLGANTCFNSYADRRAIAQTIASEYGTLRQTYQSVLSADPGMQLFVMGYPQIAAQGNCADNVHLNSTEITFSQQLIADLDDVISRAAASVGARYVDMQDALAGNRLCEAKSFQVGINGLTKGAGSKLIASESYHPNVLGHQLLAQAALRKTHNFNDTMPAPNPNVQTPSVNDPLAQALLSGYQPPLGDTGITSGRYNDSLLPDVLVRGTSSSITLDGSAHATLPGQNYRAVLHSDPTELGTFTADQDGNINGQLTIPADTPPGFHTLHLYGMDASGQPADLFQVIYVAASSDDYDGDGTSNTADMCELVPLSGQDVDQDGVDDACDGFIDEAPLPNTRYPVVVKLTGNSISSN